jgi:hypothetical protein
MTKIIAAQKRSHRASGRRAGETVAAAGGASMIAVGRDTPVLWEGVRACPSR